MECSEKMRKRVKNTVKDSKEESERWEDGR